MNQQLTPFASVVAWCLMPNHFHLIVFVNNDKIEVLKSGLEGHALTLSQGMTKTGLNQKSSDEKPSYSNSHTLTGSESMTKQTGDGNICIIGIGSNINAESNIPKMLEIMKKHVEVLKVSTFLKTKPIGIINQPDFTNGAVKVKTGLNQENLVILLKRIEDEIGRDRTNPKFGPRCIDLDIVVWNGEIVDKDYYTRDFLHKSVGELIE